MLFTSVKVLTFVEQEINSDEIIEEFGRWHSFFFHQKYDNGMIKCWVWFDINLMVNFEDNTLNMFCNLAKNSLSIDLEIYYFNLGLAIGLFLWQVECLLRNMLLKIAS